MRILRRSYMSNRVAPRGKDRGQLGRMLERGMSIAYKMFENLLLGQAKMPLNAPRTTNPRASSSRSRATPETSSMTLPTRARPPLHDRSTIRSRCAIPHDRNSRLVGQ